MKKAVRLKLEGSFYSRFLKNFIKESADKNNIKGFVREIEIGKIEIFLEGQGNELEKMINLCTNGLKYTKIRKIETKEERLQDFQDFKIIEF